MAKEKIIGFASRWGLAMALIGASVGPGSIWRFPIMAAKYGGGSFIAAMVISSILIGIPIIIAEIIMGRASRHGAPGAFANFAGGEKYSWTGWFLVVTMLAIVGFYTVCMAWILMYAAMSVLGTYMNVDTLVLYEKITSKYIWTVLAFIVSLWATAFTVSRGISRGMEKMNKIMIPSLFVLLAIVAARTLFLPGALAGLDHLFLIRSEDFFDLNTWFQGMQQSAWTVGPGWGLALTYGVYTKSKSDIALNEFTQGFGVTSAALLAGFCVFPAIYGTSATAEIAVQTMADSNYGLTFVALTNVFATIEGGLIIGVLFFIALYFGAFSSNIIMYQVVVTPLVDLGLTRKKATWIVFAVCLILGLPSAWNLDFFRNQEWVTSIMLLIGTLLTCFVIFRFGTEKMRTVYLNHQYNELYIGRWWTFVINFFIPVCVILMLIQNVVDVIQNSSTSSIWSFFATYNLGTVIYQVALVLVLLLLLNKTLAKRLKNNYFDAKTYPEIPAEHQN